MAPELFYPDRHPRIKFSATDMWALGVMAYFVLTKATLFSDRRALFRYEEEPGKFFPTEILRTANVSSEGHAFIQEILEPNIEKRPDPTAACRHPWIQPLMPPLLSESDAEDSSVTPRSLQQNGN